METPHECGTEAHDHEYMYLNAEKSLDSFSVSDSLWGNINFTTEVGTTYVEKMADEMAEWLPKSAIGVQTCIAMSTREVSSGRTRVRFPGPATSREVSMVSSLLG